MRIVDAGKGARAKIVRAVSWQVVSRKDSVREKTAKNMGLYRHCMFSGTTRSPRPRFASPGADVRDGVDGLHRRTSVRRIGIARHLGRRNITPTIPGGAS